MKCVWCGEEKSKYQMHTTTSRFPGREKHTRVCEDCADIVKDVFAEEQ
jgi:hypothetical protein